MSTQRQEETSLGLRRGHHRVLQRAVAERQDRKHALVPAQGEVEGEAECTREAGANGGLEVRADRQAVEEVGQPIEAARVDHRQHHQQEGQDRVTDEMGGLVEHQEVEHGRGKREERGPAEDQAERAVGHDTGESGGDDHFGLEVGGAVEHFGGEERTGQRSAKDGGDARPHARRHEDAALHGTQAEDAAQQRAEARADLRDRPFAAAGAAGADGHRAGHDLHERHARPDASLPVVIGGDGGVGAVALGFRGERVDDEAAQETADRGNQQEKPGTERRVGVGEERGFAAGRVGAVAGDVFQRGVHHVLTGGGEDDGAHAGDDPHQQRQAHQPHLRAEPLAADIQELGEPVPGVRGRVVRRGIGGFHPRTPSSRGACRATIYLIKPPP